MKVPLFGNLGITDSSIHNAVTNVLESGRFIGGDKVDEFAKRWAAFCGAEHCVPVASGSAALTAAIRAVVPTGKRVIVPALSFAATAFSVAEAGREIYYVDVTPDGLLDQEACKIVLEEYGSSVGGIVPVYLYGQWMRIDSSLLQWHVIEDACQAHGALTFVQGEAACFSFYPSKNLGACGDAGAIVTDNTHIAHYIRTYINYGDPPGRKYAHVMQGTNARMDAMQAAILLEKLQHGFESARNMRRFLVAQKYMELGVQSIACEPCAWHLYPVMAENPEELQDELGKHGIGSGHYYPYVLPNIVPGTTIGDITDAKFIADHVIALPMGHHLSYDQVEYVAEKLNEIAELVELEGRNVWRVKKKGNNAN